MRYFFIGSKYHLNLYQNIDKILQEEEFVIVRDRSDIRGRINMNGILICPHQSAFGDIGLYRIIKDAEEAYGIASIELTKSNIEEIRIKGLEAILESIGTKSNKSM